jgi:hypothetical protein
MVVTSRSQWPCGLRRGSAPDRLLGLWVRISPGAWMSVSCECCVLSDRGLCDELVPCPEESYRVVCLKSVIVKRRKMRWPRPPRGCRAIGKKRLLLARGVNSICAVKEPNCIRLCPEIVAMRETGNLKLYLNCFFNLNRHHFQHHILSTEL